ncbi:glutaredoxin family protein [Vagococcus fluvialis]|uniref:glutaredoxin family protein n=1 Tax=Vagococcus fluvialis TaxID=2738 RepID=UPI001D0A3A20|nr:glutaredoxin domain-containing protein [Vagococcus fluvialis]UDM72705.1 glutaredoxin family protein [Vagococcus fluvialis]UDM78428.1 glutaredoxin family protein [Vagococcus fluvialis]UDM83980.1 glutaredoxin family protein [Vagococcus fluvialis]
MSKDSKVIVFSKAGCGQCFGAKMFLKQHNIPFEEIDIEASDENRKNFDQYGFDSLPVIVSPVIEPFSGFRPSNLQEIKEGMIS